MIDIHCHILPDFDDGAADLVESLAMARLAAASGVTGIVATPHFRGEEESLEDLSKLVSRLVMLNEAISKARIPVAVYPGCEILCLPQTPRMGKAGQLPTLGDTNYLLCEFFFNESPVYMDEMLRTLRSYGYRIVVAHPERYEAVQRDPGLAEKWFGNGYVLQLNKGSILGAFGPKVQQTAGVLLDGGLVHLFASDAHSASRRTTDMRPLRQHLSERCPEAYVRVLLEENPRRLIAGQDMVPAE